MTSRPVPRNTRRDGRGPWRSTATATLTGPLRSRRRVERQVRIAADGGEVGLAPSFGAGLHQRGDRRAGHRPLARRHFARARPVGQPAAEARRQRMRRGSWRDRPPTPTAPRRRWRATDRRPGCRRRARRTGRRSLPARRARRRAPSGANTGPSITSSRPPPSTNVQQRRELGRRQRLRRLGDHQHAAAGRGGVGDPRERAHVVAVAAQLVRERRVAAVPQRLDVGLAVPRREADAQRLVAGDGQQRRQKSRLAPPGVQRRARLAVGVELRLDQVLPGHDLRPLARREHDRRPAPSRTRRCRSWRHRRLGALRIPVGIDELRRESARPRRACSARPARAAAR